MVAPVAIPTLSGPVAKLNLYRLHCQLETEPCSPVMQCAMQESHFQAVHLMAATGLLTDHKCHYNMHQLLQSPQDRTICIAVDLQQDHSKTTAHQPLKNDLNTRNSHYIPAALPE